MGQETVGDLIRRLRTERYLDQTTLADQAGMPRSSLAGIETNRVDRPSVDVLQRLAAALRIHPNILLRAAGYRVGEPPPIKPRTIGDILDELTARTRELEHSADKGDESAQAELRHLARAFTRVGAPTLRHTAAGFLTIPTR